MGICNGSVRNNVDPYIIRPFFYIWVKYLNKMDVITRINKVIMILPNPGLMSSSAAIISRALDILRPVIQDERVVDFVNRIRQQDIRTELLKIYWCEGSRGTVGDHTYLTSLSFLLASPGISHPDMMRIFDEVEHVFNASPEEHVRAEAADLMYRFFPERGERLLDELRMNRDQIPPEFNMNIDRDQIPPEGEFNMNIVDRDQIPPEDIIRGQLDNLRRIVDRRNIIYDDSQNVHNTTINESVIAAARALIEEMVATVTFDGRYTLNVFRDDTIKSVTYRLANILKRCPKDVKIIVGDNERLQTRMTYKIINDAKSTTVSRFKYEDMHRYMDVIYLDDYIFPTNVVREGKLGRCLEEIFITTNIYLTNVYTTKVEEELLFYLDLCRIEDAVEIWSNRNDILRDLYAVIGNDNERDEEVVNEFLDEIVTNIFPDKDMSSFIKRIKTGMVRDVKLLDLLNAVWKFIYTKHGETFTQLKKRLREEILESMDVCTSGVCAHLVSVIQGFFDEEKQPSLKIKMSIMDELNAKLAQNINKLAIEKNADPVMERDSFKKLVDDYITINADEILDGFTYDEIKMNGLSKQKIIDLAYTIYSINEKE